MTTQVLSFMGSQTPRLEVDEKAVIVFDSNLKVVASTHHTINQWAKELLLERIHEADIDTVTYTIQLETYEVVDLFTDGLTSTEVTIIATNKNGVQDLLFQDTTG